MIQQPDWKAERGAIRARLEADSEQSFPEDLRRLLAKSEEYEREIERLNAHIKDLNHDMEKMKEGYGEAFESGYDCAERQ